jgi:hypothetical protein
MSGVGPRTTAPPGLIVGDRSLASSAPLEGADDLSYVANWVSCGWRGRWTTRARPLCRMTPTLRTFPQDRTAIFVVFESPRLIHV